MEDVELTDVRSKSPSSVKKIDSEVSVSFSEVSIQGDDRLENDGCTLVWKDLCVVVREKKKVRFVTLKCLSFSLLDFAQFCFGKNYWWFLGYYGGM